MKKTITMMLLMAVTLISTSSCQKKQPFNQKTFVLVHGAFQAPYVWQVVQAQLQAAGQKVIVVQLPGHGNDTTPPADLSIDAYRDKVIAAINTVQGKVILVGHSMGGMVISATAEMIPNRIEKMVYIAGFVPANGQSLIDLASTDSQSELGPALMPSKDGLTLNIAKDSIVPIFCADGSAYVQNLLISNYRPEPAIPFGSKVSVTPGNFGSVDKYYIHTLQDKAIGIALQNRMVAAAGITKLYTINSSHSPFLSKPDSVTAILLNIIK